MKRTVIATAIVFAACLTLTIPSRPVASPASPTSSTGIQAALAISALANTLAPTGECAFEMTCNACESQMREMEEGVILSGGTACMANNAAYVYCIGNCPSCMACKVRMIYWYSNCV